MRLRRGAAPATLHRELTILKRMLNLCAASLARLPRIEMPRVANAREGFFEEPEVQAVLRELPHHAKHLVEFLYLTGWRAAEALTLKWSDVRFARKRATLRSAHPTTRKPRGFPLPHAARLETV